MTAASYVTRKEAAELSGASESVINKAIEQRVIPTRRMKTGAALDVRDVAVLALFSELTSFGLPVMQKKKLRAWLRDAATAELVLNRVLVVRRTDQVEAAMSRAQRYVELRDRYVESNPSDPRRRAGGPRYAGPDSRARQADRGRRDA